MKSMQEHPADIVEIGIQDVDDEHRFQFRLLSNMQAAVDASDRASALALLQQLYSYSDAHFAAEQVFMRLHSYPACNTHEREHGDLLFELRRMTEAAKNGGDLRDFPEMIRKWLVSHINSSDAAFGKWVKLEEQRNVQA